jgi:transposase InsO family protein
MKEVFSRHGIPETVVSDNGTQYSSREFKMFSMEWGFNHVTSSPNYAQANGKSERAVQTVKSLLKKSINSNEDFQLALLNYRNTPRDGLSSPAQLLMSRQLRCKLPGTPRVVDPATRRSI